MDTGTLNSSPRTDGHAAGAAALRSRRAFAAEGVGGDFCGQSLSGRPWTCPGYHRCPWLSPLSPLVPWGLQDLMQSSSWGPGSIPNRTCVPPCRPLRPLTPCPRRYLCCDTQADLREWFATFLHVQVGSGHGTVHAVLQELGCGGMLG